MFHGGKFNGHWFEPQRSLGMHFLPSTVHRYQRVRNEDSRRQIGRLSSSLALLCLL